MTRVLPQVSIPQKSASPTARGGDWKTLAAVVAIVLAVCASFVIGQQTRPSNAEVDQKIGEAVDQTKNSAVASFRREFDRQRERLQEQFNQRVKAAEAKAREQGRADATKEQGSGVVGTIERCLKNFLLDC